ncbi:hypothetical protein ACFV2N_12770 [Streptomyces sp. NPDC059680]|uniref:hypothetical protein n=1 Tax=Streptomyces TaxID=1883 RepID=UPI001E2C806A|nr:hypothetical protein [Streptomyces barringtoniae]MCC5480362.1 hypothetical protein [Streptomyces barringtoniae]
MSSSAQPTAAVAGLALTVAVLLSLVAALLAVIVRTSTAGRLTDALPAAAVAFSATMGLSLAGLAGVGLLRS